MTDEINYMNMDGPELLAACGADGHKWAKAFCQHYPSALSQIKGREGVTQGEDFEGVMIGWFCNAIMNTHDIITGNGPVVLPDGSAFVGGTVDTNK